MNFISVLRAKAKYCTYGDLEESIIVDMIINRVNDSKCTEKLMELSDDQLTINNVIRVCRQVELTQAHLKSLEKKNMGEQQVHYAQENSRGRNRGRNRGNDYVRGRGNNQQNQMPSCNKCCRSHGQDYCRADQEYCGACGLKGHFRKSPICRAAGAHNTFSRGQNFNHGSQRGYGSQNYYSQSSHRGFSGQNPNSYSGRYARGRGRSYGYGQSRGRNVHYVENNQNFDHNADYDVDNIGYFNNGESVNSEMNEMFDMFDTLHTDVNISVVVQGSDVTNDDVCVEVENEQESNVDIDVLDTGHTTDVFDNDFHVTLYTNDKPLQVELDTGAKCNIVSFQTIKEIGLSHKMQPSSLFIRGVHGQSVKAVGSIILPCMYKGVVKDVEFQVLDGAKNINLLGRTDCIRFGFIARVYKVSASESCQPIVDRYKDVFGDEIGCLPGEFDIKIDENATPVVHPPRSVPAPLRDKVKQELERLENANIIKKVTEPTPWVSSMVVVSKKDKDRVRICIDPSDLNKAIQREHFPMNNIDDIATRLSGSRYFSTLDANMGYFQIKLSERSSYLTTFNTPFGRYRMLRMPMGARCSADKFQSALVEAFGGIEGVEIVQDDILIHGKTMAEHEQRLVRVLQKCREINLKLNKKKCHIGLQEVNYVGHKITSEGLKPTDERVKAISSMKSPENVKELETILGMIAYVGKFIPSLSELTAPLRELKKQENWYWNNEHQTAFEKIKAELTSDRVLKYYDVNKPLLISVDASCKGLGAAAIQDGAVIAYASRALTPTEQRYAQIEKEMLAVVYGCTKFHKLVYGKNDVTVESDHKPLETLLKKPMCAAPMRIQRMRLKLEPYTFNLIHISGKSIGLADCLSRFPQDGSANDISIDEELMVCKIDTLAFKWHSEIENATKNDEDMLTLKTVIFNGWPSYKQSLPNSIIPYWDVRDQLSMYNGIVYKGERIVIPKSLRTKLLGILHQSHMGIVKTKRRARDMIYWPGLNTQIEEMVRKCEFCLENHRKQQKEPMTIHPLPILPWNKVGTDLFEFEGIHYLIMVDYYSNFIEVSPLHRDTRAACVIKQIKMNIARYGIMETLISDNGPQFTSSEFEDFARKYQINHITSSPTHQQSNGLAEEGVKQVKDLMKKCKQSGQDFFLALLDLRNTPRDDVLGSPMQRLQGRRAQTSLPIADSLLRPAVMQPDQVHERMMDYRRKQKFYYDKTAQTLQPIKTDQAIRVWTPDGWKPAEYIGQHQLPNSHTVKAGTQGRLYRRNRKHLMITGEQPHVIQPPEPYFPTIPRNQNPSQPPQQPYNPTTVKPIPTQTQSHTPTITTTPKPTPPPQIPINRPIRQKRDPVWLKDYVKN